jgi:membrane-associated protein
LSSNTSLLRSIVQQHEILAYAIVFALSIPEGPILTVACGFLAKSGILNPLVVYALVVSGDMIGDSTYYALGRFGGTALLRRVGPRLGFTTARLEDTRKYFEARRMKMLSLSKLVHGVGVLGLVLAGATRFSYRRFCFGCAAISLAQSGILLALGLVTGHAYEEVGRYLNMYAAALTAVAIAVCAFVIVRRCLAKIPGLVG